MIDSFKYILSLYLLNVNWWGEIYFVAYFLNERTAHTEKAELEKSTTVSNMSVALAGKGYTVMQLRDPKADSTISLRQGRNLTQFSILTGIRSKTFNLKICIPSAVRCYLRGSWWSNSALLRKRGVAKALIWPSKEFRRSSPSRCRLLRCARRRSM